MLEALRIMLCSPHPGDNRAAACRLRCCLVQSKTFLLLDSSLSSLAADATAEFAVGGCARLDSSSALPWPSRPCAFAAGCTSGAVLLYQAPLRIQRLLRHAGADAAQPKVAGIAETGATSAAL